MDNCIFCLVCIVVEIILILIAYLIREYWYDPYYGLFRTFVPYFLMLSCLISAFIVSLFCSRALVHIIHDYVFNIFIPWLID